MVSDHAHRSSSRQLTHASLAASRLLFAPAGILPASLATFSACCTATRLHQSRTQIVKKFRVNFVVVFRWNCVEGGKSLTEGRREGCYPRGGRSSDGVESGTLSVPANRSIACRTAPARRIDSLHCRCLTSNSLACG